MKKSANSSGRCAPRLLSTTIIVVLSLMMPIVAVAQASGSNSAAPPAVSSSEGSATDAAKAVGTSIFPSPVVTHHRGVFNGIHVRYTATVEAIDVPRPDDHGGARVVSFAYTRDKIGDPSARPVLFLFNGGPIVASIWIHLGLGPKRVESPSDLNAGEDAYKLIDNLASPLDAVDLVFIDPADTGFSRRLPGTDVKTYHSVESDGQQIAGFIQRWLTKHGRMKSPVYIAGESYGTVRAPEVVRQLAALRTPVVADGVFLLGQAVNIIEYSQRPTNIISYAVSLPTLAAIAWYHGKVDRAGHTFEQFVEQARRYGGAVYLQALFQGQDLPADQKRQVAECLARFSGIPADYYLAHDLKITKEEFRAELLKNRRLLLGRNDARYVAPMTDKGVAPDPSSTIDQAYARIWGGYLRDQLKVTTGERYLPMAEIKGLEDWGWGGSSPFDSYPYGQAITQLMRINPKFRLLIGNGYYDTQTTIGAADYLRTQSGWPADRVALRFYQGGHMSYTVDESARRIANDLRALVTGQTMESLPEEER